MKSEPDVFSIDDLARDQRAPWDGVRNYQARNNLRAMKQGDDIFFYHSNAKPAAIVGRMKVLREAYADPKDPVWTMVDVGFVEKFKKPVTLEAIRAMPPLRDMVLVRNSRLSVQPVTRGEWAFLLKKAAFLMIGGWLAAAPTQAACTYFLTKTRAGSCKAIQVPPSPDHEAITAEDALEAAVEKDDGRRIQLICECDYSLSGSDPRCDFDRMDEIPQLLMETDVKTVCREKKKRCRMLCPPRVTDGKSR